MTLPERLGRGERLGPAYHRERDVAGRNLAPRRPIRSGRWRRAVTSETSAGRPGLLPALRGRSGRLQTAESAIPFFRAPAFF